MVGDTYTGLRHHLQIVCAIPHRDDLFRLKAQLLAYFYQPFCLAFCIEYLAQHATGELAVDDLQCVGMSMIQTKAGFETFGEKQESAGYEQRLDAVFF